MLRYQLLHPEILAALGSLGHGGQILIADGNYPFATRAHPLARRVYLNFTPGLLSVTDVLRVLIDAIPIEAAHVMVPDTGEEPSIFREFRELMPERDLYILRRFDFYAAAATPDVGLVIATAERRVYANLLLTIGVVPPEEG